ncbi:beta-N-acetylglucosaminidase domain-containing protein [bacterium]|nr:beta-N-acetylglucosaminidase domain-containing protein [bacterium]
MLTLCAMALGASGANAAEALTGLLPTPKAVRVGEGRLTLGPATYAFAGKASPQTDYAVEVLAQLFGAAPTKAAPGCVRLQLVTSAQDLAAAARSLKLPVPPADRWQEAFVLDSGVSGAGVRVTGGLSGLIYGVYALCHLRRHEGSGLTVPRCAISDWPTLLARAYTGVPRDPKSPSFVPTLDWLARWRINGCYYEIYGDQGQDSAPEDVSRLHEECARRGIALYGQISNWRTERLLKRELCASNPEDIEHIRRYSRELLDRGCDGLIFLFDDITQAAAEHPLHCEQCQARFGNLAACQLELMRPMLEEGRQRGVQRLIVCPTPYYQGWPSTQQGKLDGRQYYATWGAADLMKGVQVYHCQLRASDIAELQQAGLRNYIYWCNGFYPYDQCVPEGQRVAGLWGGLGELPFGWYTETWDATQGVVPTPDAYGAFRELPKLTQHAWLCGGGEWPWALWGCYCWDAARFEDCEPRLVTTVYGAGTAEPYATYKGLVRGWLVRLAQAGGVPTAGRDAFVAQLAGDAAKVKLAAEGFAQATTVGLDAALPEARRRDTAAQMLRSAETMAKLAETARSGKAVARLDPERQLGGGVCERRMEIGDFWTRFRLRYSQTTDADGTKHRTRWHFGSGLGMIGPSYRNWYDAGFVDVLVNGKSLDALTPQFERVPGAAGEELVGTWQTDTGTVTLRFGVWQGGLRIAGQWAGDPQARLAVRLFAIPSAGNWPDMDKFVTTPSGTTPHGKPVTLQPSERWLFLADKTYDVPHEHAEGPCAVLFGDPLPAVQCDNGSYVVQIDGEYPAGTKEFRLAVWDFHGLRNAEALATLQGTMGRGELP